MVTTPLDIHKNEYIISTQPKKYGGCRRVVQRSLIRPGAVAVLKKSSLLGLLKAPKKHSATIIDMSASGAKLKYNTGTSWAINFDAVSIATADSQLNIPDIPCKIVSDALVERRPDNIFIRDCGIEFVDISEEKRQRLSRFIRAYAIDSDSLPKAWHIEFA